jgi:hypothetical protein
MAFRRGKMNTDKKTTGMEDMKVRLSTLWIFAMFNYLYADIVTLMNPDELKKILIGNAGPIQITPEFLLVAAVLMETAIAMVLLSRVLRYRANRWANIIVGILQTAAVLSSMFVGTPPLYYIFFIIIEVACTSFIVWYAWNWTKPEGSPE